MAEAVHAAKSGKSGKIEPAWPAFRSTKPDPVLGKRAYVFSLSFY